MAQELQYTSVAEGLKPGSRGFCAVVMTRGMSNQVAERLEALSGYDMYYKVGSPHIDSNPRHYAHWLVKLEGKVSHVFSFVTYSGMDFEGRANKFAHHIQLDDSDLVLGGPGWLIMHQAVMERWYMAPPRWIEPRTMPKGDVVACRPDYWIKVYGDAGWAGTLAQHLLDEPTKPVYIIFPITIDPLPLIGEALALLPKAERWKATFSTYFTRISADMTCALRCCLDGTPAATEAREAAGRTLVIDLTAPWKPAPKGALANAARSAPPRFNPASLNRTDDPNAETAASVPMPATSAPPPDALPPSEAVAAAKVLPPLDTPLVLPPSTPPPEPPVAPPATPPKPEPPAAPPPPLSLPANTPPEVRNDISLPSPVPAPSFPRVSAQDEQKPGESKDAQRTRHFEPTSMLDLGNEENEAAELEDAMQRQKRAKIAKTRAAGDRVQREKKAVESRESSGPDLDAEEDGADDRESPQETTVSAFDSSVGQAAQQNEPAEKPASAAEPIPKATSRAAKWSVVLAIIAVAAVLAVSFSPRLKSFIFTSGSAPLGSHNTADGVLAQPIDPNLPGIVLDPVAIPANPNFFAVAMNLDAPSPSAPVPAEARLCVLKRSSGHGPATDCTLDWLVGDESSTPATALLRKGNRIDVTVVCEASVDKAGSIAVASLLIEKNELIWRWIYPSVWTKKMQDSWGLIAPALAQSIVTVREPAGTEIAKIQLILPIARSLQPGTGSAVFSGLQPTAPPMLAMAALPPGWRSSEPEAGKSLELTHVSGAKVTINLMISQSIWSIVAAWPSDSQAELLAVEVAKQEQAINQLLTLKTSAQAVAETQGDVDRLKDELDRMKTQIDQAKARVPEDRAAVTTLETRNQELATNFKQLSEKLEKMKSAPSDILALRALRKTGSDRLDAVNALAHTPLFLTSSVSHAVLAVVNLVNSSSPPDNAATAP